jgi:hypothetical protein
LPMVLSGFLCPIAILLTALSRRRSCHISQW